MMFTGHIPFAYADDTQCRTRKASLVFVVRKLKVMFHASVAAGSLTYRIWSLPQAPHLSTITLQCRTAPRAYRAPHLSKSGLDADPFWSRDCGEKAALGQGEVRTAMAEQMP